MVLLLFSSFTKYFSILQAILCTQLKADNVLLPVCLLNENVQEPSLGREVIENDEEKLLVWIQSRLFQLPSLRFHARCRQKFTCCTPVTPLNVYTHTFSPKNALTKDKFCLCLKTEIIQSTGKSVPRYSRKTNEKIHDRLNSSLISSRKLTWKGGLQATFLQAVLRERPGREDGWSPARNWDGGPTRCPLGTASLGKQEALWLWKSPRT